MCCPDSQSARVEVAERFADGQASSEELAAAHQPFLDDFLRRQAGNWDQTEEPADASAYIVTQEFALNSSSNTSRHRPKKRGLQARQISLLRCTFGNPFRPIQVDPAWLALERRGRCERFPQTIYDQRRFPDLLPLLADAARRRWLCVKRGHPCPLPVGDGTRERLLGRGFTRKQKVKMSKETLIPELPGPRRLSCSGRRISTSRSSPIWASAGNRSHWRKKWWSSADSRGKIMGNAGLTDFDPLVAVMHLVAVEVEGLGLSFKVPASGRVSPDGIEVWCEAMQMLQKDTSILGAQ